MYKKITSILAFCGLLIIANTKTCEINSAIMAATADAYKSSSSSQQNSPRNTKEFQAIPIQDPNLKEDYVITKGRSYDNLGYKFTYNKNGEKKKVTCKVNDEDKKNMISATHIKIQEYDQNGNPVEYILKKESSCSNVQPLAMCMTEQNEIISFEDILPSNTPCYDHFNHEINTDYTTIYYNAPQHIQISSKLLPIFQQYMLVTKTFAIKLPTINNPPSLPGITFSDTLPENTSPCPITLFTTNTDHPTISYKDNDGKVASIILPVALKKQSQPYMLLTYPDRQIALALPNELINIQGLFTKASTMHNQLYQGLKISLDHFETNSNRYVYTVTYQDEGKISEVTVNTTKLLDKTDKYINVMGTKESSFSIELPQPTQQHLSPITTILGISAFAAIIIAILYKYNQFPESFNNALNKILQHKISLQN